MDAAGNSYAKRNVDTQQRNKNSNSEMRFHSFVLFSKKRNINKILSRNTTLKYSISDFFCSVVTNVSQ